MNENEGFSTRFLFEKAEGKKKELQMRE